MYVPWTCTSVRLLSMHVAVSRLLPSNESFLTFVLAWHTLMHSHPDSFTLSLPHRIRRGSNSYTQHKPTLPSSRSILSTSTTNSSYAPTSPPFSPPGAPSILRISDPSSVERYRYETCSSTTSNSGQSDESDAGITYTYNISPSPPAVEVDTPDLRAQVSQ